MTFDEWIEQQGVGVAACDHVTYGRKVWEGARTEIEQQLAALTADLETERRLSFRNQVVELERQLFVARNQIVELNAEVERKQSAASFLLAERKKQNALLRDALHGVILATDPFVMLRYATEVFDATRDLSKYILCDAEPVADVKKHTGEFKDMAIIVWRGEQPAEGTKLYKEGTKK